MTAVPGCIDGLLAMLRSRTGLVKVEIVDGEWLEPPDRDRDVVVIGWLPEDGYSVEWIADPASLAVNDDRETFTIHGFVSINSGSANERAVKAVRDHADQVFEEVRAAVRSDPTLRGACSRAHVSAVTAAPSLDESGCAFTISFAVNVTVF